MYSTIYCFPILMILEFSQQSFEKGSNIKFHQNLASGSRVVPCGRTQIHDKSSSRFSQFCKLAKKRCLPRHSALLSCLLHCDKDYTYRSVQNPPQKLTFRADFYLLPFYFMMMYKMRLAKQSKAN